MPPLRTPLAAVARRTLDEASCDRVVVVVPPLDHQVEPRVSAVSTFAVLDVMESVVPATR